MPDVQAYRSSRVSAPACEQLAESIRADFNALARLLARFNPDLPDDQLDSMIRAKAAVAQGIELSERLFSEG
jgi:hypothetical protein